MNIYEKIQCIKKELLEKNLKKSGHNKFAGYTYYELADITPSIIELCNEHKLFTRFSYNKEDAILEIVNIENTEEKVIYTSPMEELELKGCNKIQALGGTETYQRRYLYMSAFDIIENDMFDATIEEITTKEEALKLELTFGKYKGKILNEVKDDEDYMQWLFEKSTDERIRKGVALIMDYEIKSEEELKTTVQLLGKIKKLMNEKNVLPNEISDNFNKKSSDMSDEELQGVIEWLVKK